MNNKSSSEGSTLFAIGNSNNNIGKLPTLSTTTSASPGSLGASDSETTIQRRRGSTSSDAGVSQADKLLKTLQFRNPGPQLSAFDPDKSKREMRKLKRLALKEQASKRRRRKAPKKQTFHDEYGIRISDKRDVCDCQNLDCPGCHFPCPSCGSEKCGVECRCGRQWTYDGEVDFQTPSSRQMFTSTGTNTRFNFSK